MANPRFNFLSVMAVVLMLLATSSSGQSEPPQQRTEEKFSLARSQFQNQRDNFEVAWKFGRACFDWADFAVTAVKREEIANQGIAACQRAILHQPKSIEGHYYLAMNFGQLARTKTLGALKLVEEMEKEFKLTREIDEKFDFAGPHRNLGLLYLEAPRWPTSIGDRSKARHHLERAAKLSPNYPENRLNLLEAYLKWADKNGAQRELKALKEIWPDAKKKFAGENWELSWMDWEKRWEKIQAKLAKSPINLESPRQKIK